MHDWQRPSRAKNGILHTSRFPNLLPKESRHELNVKGLDIDVKDEDLRELISLYAEPEHVYVQRQADAKGGAWANINFHTEVYPLRWSGGRSEGCLEVGIPGVDVVEDCRDSGGGKRTWRDRVTRHICHPHHLRPQSTDSKSIFANLRYTTTETHTQLQKQPHVRDMLKGPSNQPGPHAAIDTGKANEDQSVRKHDVIRGILGFSKSKTEKADAITTNQAVHAQNTPQVPVIFTQLSTNLPHPALILTNLCLHLL
ncbi:hypothetical protein BKA57DRAFT_489512 [Linnemannia elongata]|nr:hypothetical protein BKA57DRAFT_489512 [Linnemannia elongata]